MRTVQGPRWSGYVRYPRSEGFYPVEDAYTLNQPHTNFPSHTDRTKTPGVTLTTGSLGQGMSTATGAALGNKLDGRDIPRIRIVGDGECDEGQVWELLSSQLTTSWTTSFAS